MKSLGSFNEEKEMEFNLYVAYTECWRRLMKVVSNMPEKDFTQLSNPFLVKCLPSYRKAKKKVLFIGQETNGWEFFQETLQLFNGGRDDRVKDDIIEYLQWMYEDFRFQQQWNYTPYWQGLRAIYQAIVNNDMEDGFLNTQLVRFDLNQKRPTQAIEDLMQKEYNVLPMEIAALKPDIVIFLTGPYYDDRIKSTFTDSLVRGDQLKFHPVDGLSENQLSRLSHPSLPQHTYRTYHPGYSLRYKQEIFIPIIEAIKVLTQR